MTQLKTADISLLCHYFRIFPAIFTNYFSHNADDFMDSLIFFPIIFISWRLITLQYSFINSKHLKLLSFYLGTRHVFPLIQVIVFFFFLVSE